MKISNLLFSFCLLIVGLSTQAQVGIGTNTPAASAQLEVSSSTKGFLPPRMLASERAAIGSPVAGLMVYQTDGTKGLYYYDGSSWIFIIPTNISGNAATATNLTGLTTSVATLNNVSGSNSGDETAASIKTKLGITTLSGSNTGDQDLSSYATSSALGNKVDKVTGKDLSTNDYTTTEKTKLAGITGTNTGDQDLTGKVDKVTGKGLSTNDYTSTEQTKLAAITGTNTGDETTATIKTKLGVTTLSGNNTGDQDLSSYATSSALGNKVDKVTGKDLSTNDYTTTEKTKLAGITGSNTGDQTLPTLTSLGAVAGNTAITGATKTKVTYDAKGLVTAGADATTADIAASTDKNYVTDAQKIIIGNTTGTNSGNETAATIKTALGITTLSGSNTGDQTTITGNAGSATNLAAGVAGAIPYQTAANTTGFTAAGSNGQVLTVAGGVPTWAAAASSGVPYTGATGAVNLGAYDLTVNGVKIGKGLGNVATNTAVGSTALNSNTSGGFNTSIGVGSLKTNTTGAYNTSVGTNALLNNTNASNNIAVGSEALQANTTGGSNTSIGNAALATNTIGSNNTAIGAIADVFANNLTNATAIGYGAIVAASNTIQLGNTSITNLKTSGTITAGTVTYPNGHNATEGQVLTINGTGGASFATNAAASSVAAISGTSSPSGALISNVTGTLTLTPADASNGGVLTNTTQTIAGAKTLTSSLSGNVNGASTFANFSANINAQTGTSYTLTAADNGKIITLNNSAAITLTVPPSFAGFNCMIVQLGAGAVTLTAYSTTISNRSSLTKTAGANAIVTLIALSANSYISAGDMQ